MKPKSVALKMIGSEAELLKNLLANIALGMKPTSSLLMHCECESTIVKVEKKTYNGKTHI